MAKVHTSISIDAEVKEQAQQLFADFGMDLPTAVNVFLRQAIYEQAMPFAVSRANAVTMQAIEDAEAGDVFGPYDTVDELLEALSA